MIKKVLIFVLLLSTVFFTYAAYEYSQLKIPYIKKSLKIDGHLDEFVWTEAGKISNLYQQEPVENSPESEHTEVYVFYNDDYFYSGIKSFDREPEKIIAYSMKRDFMPCNDDHIMILLDPFNDRRNAYVFAINPNGAKFDGLIVNNSERIYRAWDGIWYASARKGSNGWYAEIAIPFKTLTFNRKINQWGFNIRRKIKRKIEEDRWASPFHQVYFTKVAEAGYLRGIKGVKQGKGLDVRPYGLVGEQKNHSPSEFNYDGGIDIFCNITPALKASLTYNTDFAETEVDERRINLTRFPLFFPEKRRFFLEGSDIFSFNGANPFSFLPFHSRRIGLIEGE